MLWRRERAAGQVGRDRDARRLVLFWEGVTRGWRACSRVIAPSRHSRHALRRCQRDETPSPRPDTIDFAPLCVASNFPSSTIRGGVMRADILRGLAVATLLAMASTALAPTRRRPAVRPVEPRLQEVRRHNRRSPDGRTRQDRPGELGSADCGGSAETDRGRRPTSRRSRSTLRRTIASGSGTTRCTCLTEQSVSRAPGRRSAAAGRVGAAARALPSPRPQSLLFFRQSQPNLTGVPSPLAVWGGTRT